LLEFKVAQVFLNNRRHGHAQGRSEILYCHFALLFLVRQELDQASRQIFGTPWFVKINRQLLTIGHLAEIRKVGTQDGHAISASQVSYPAASS
jgi:hypothetical protein